MNNAQNSSLKRVFASRAFLSVWMTGLCAGVMRWLEILAVGVYTLEATGSALAVALMYFARTVPTLVLGPVAGVLAERISRNSLYIGALLVMFTVSSVLSVLAASQLLELWHVALGAVLSGSVWSFEHTVRRTIARDVVPPDTIGNAISLDTGSQNATRMMGPLVGGVIMTVVGLTGAFVIGAVLYALALFLMLGVPQVAQQPASAAPSFWDGIVDGLRYVRERPALAGVLVVTIVLNLFGFPYVSMVPVIGRDEIGLEPDAIGLMAAAEGLGAVLGAMVLAVTVESRHYRRLFTGGASLFMVMMIVFAHAGTMMMGAASLLLAGIGLGLFAAMQSTILLTGAEAHMRSRVMGMLVVTIGAGPFGVLMLGTLAEYVGASNGLLMTASTGSVLLLLAVVRWPVLMSGD
ncbi:MAG: MFS transporter [Pseudomonadota bacterium]